MRAEDVDLDAPDPALAKPKTQDSRGSDAGTDVSQKGPTLNDAAMEKVPKADEATADGPTANEAGSNDVIESGFEVIEASRQSFLDKIAPYFASASKHGTAAARKMMPDIEQAALDFGMSGAVGAFQARTVGFALARAAQAAFRPETARIRPLGICPLGSSCWRDPWWCVHHVAPPATRLTPPACSSVNSAGRVAAH